MNYSHTKKVIAVLSSLCIISIGVLVVLIILIRNNTYRLAEYQHQIAEQDTTNATNHALRDLLANQGDAIDKLEGHIVAKEGTVSLIESIESLARKQGLSIKVNEVQEKNYDQLPTTYELLDLSLTVDGAWNGQYAFLSMLESLPYKVSLDSAALTSSIEDPESASTADVASSTKKAAPQKAKITWTGLYSLSVLKYK